MSVLGAIFAIFAFLISPWGMAAILAGFLAFFMLPVASAVSSFKKPAHFMLWLASQPIRRAAIVVSEANDIIFKQMSYQGIGVESITLGDDEKLFGDPDGALHRWLGMPFALANEEHGVLFDPRHAALGAREHALKTTGDDEFPATEAEYDESGVTKWTPGVFEMPDAPELVDLSKVTELIDGGERAEYPKRVEELYKHSQDPFADATPMMKFLYPVIGWAIPFFGIWLLASQLGGPAGGAGSTVGYGAFLLFSLGDIDWRLLARSMLAAVVFVGVPVGLLIAIAMLFNPLIALAVFLAFSMGFLLLPMLSFLFRPSKRVSGVFSNFFFRLGFMGYESPVFYWTPERYELREYRTLDDTHDVTWYSLFGTRVGFTFPPDEDSWGAETMSRDALESEGVATDGGQTTTNTNVPEAWQKTDSIRKGNYGGLVPASLSEDAYYLNSQIALGRFSNSAVGEKSLRRLLEAKEKYGGGEEGIADSTVAYLTAGMAVLGIGMGVFFFLL